MSDDEDLQVVVALASVAYLERHNSPPTSDSIQMTADCGHLCWISANGLEYLATHLNARTECTECMEEKISKTTSISPVPGALEAVAKEFGVGAADQVGALLRDMNEMAQENTKRRGKS